MTAPVTVAIVPVMHTFHSSVDCGFGRAASISCLLCLACGGLTTAQDGGSSPPAAAAPFEEIAEGYELELVLSGLTYPTSVEMRPGGETWIAEAGYSYGDAIAPARILEIAPDGRLRIMARGLQAPINDLLVHEDRLLVSHRGRISWVDPTSGTVQDIVTGLPSDGDHQNNQLTIGPDGMIYVGQGTATNSGVVGVDNAMMGWLRRHPSFHDMPPRTLQLNPACTYQTPNPLTPGEAETVTTAPFQPFGESAARSIGGVPKANGTILRFQPDGRELEVYAWGLRNPFGLAWGPDGSLYATENGFDVRGSRPIANDWEDLYRITEGGWYGWPDFASGIPVTDPRFRPEGGESPGFIMTEHPEVEKPLMRFPPHSAICKIDFGTNDAFSPEGEMYVAFWGSMVPMTGSVDEHGGHRVLAINLQEGTSRVLVRGSHGGGHGEHAGKAEHAEPRELLQRPIDVVMAPDGIALYIVDFGQVAVRDGVVVPSPGTGRLWRLRREDVAHQGPPAGLKLVPRTASAEETAGSTDR